MRPHTHTRRAAHAPASHLEPRSRSPSCAKRVYVTSPKRHTRHGSCARTARSSQRTQDRMWFDLSSQTATQTRASNEARNDGPLRQRARELRHRVLGAVHAVVLDSTARPRLLDLQLPRRQTSSALLRASGSWVMFVRFFCLSLLSNSRLFRNGCSSELFTWANGLKAAERGGRLERCRPNDGLWQQFMRLTARPGVWRLWQQFSRACRRRARCRARRGHGQQRARASYAIRRVVQCCRWRCCRCC